MPATFRVEITDQAKADIADVWDYIAQDSPANASAWVLGIEKQVALLSHSPERCPRIPENEMLGTSYRHIIYGPYRVVFRVTGSQVTILRVIHGARLLDASFFAR